MIVHDEELKYDVINTLGNAINPITSSELVLEVINKGFKKNWQYIESDILEVLQTLVDMKVVKRTDDKYEWIK